MNLIEIYNLSDLGFYLSTRSNDKYLTLSFNQSDVMVNNKVVDGYYVGDGGTYVIQLDMCEFVRAIENTGIPVYMRYEPKKDPNTIIIGHTYLNPTNLVFATGKMLWDFTISIATCDSPVITHDLIDARARPLFEMLGNLNGRHAGIYLFELFGDDWEHVFDKLDAVAHTIENIAINNDNLNSAFFVAETASDFILGIRELFDMIDTPRIIRFREYLTTAISRAIVTNNQECDCDCDCDDASLPDMENINLEDGLGNILTNMNNFKL